MIDFNQLINTAIANGVELAVRDQLTPYILQLEEQAKVIGFLNAEIANLKAPVEVPVELSGEHIDHYIGEWMNNNRDAINDWVYDWVSCNGDEVFAAAEYHIDNRIESALEDYEFDTDSLANELLRRLDIDDKIRDFINCNVTVDISA